MSITIRQQSYQTPSGADTGPGPPFSSILFDKTQDFRFLGATGWMDTSMIVFCDDFALARVISSGHEISVFEEQQAALLMPDHGSLTITRGGSATEVPAGGMVAVRPGRSRTRADPGQSGRFIGYVLTVPLVRLTPPDHPQTGLLHDRASAPLSSKPARRLRACLAFLIEEVLRPDSTLRSPKAQEGCHAIVNDLLEDLLTSSGSGSMEHSLGLARLLRAEEILRARSDEALSITDLAADLGVGVRSLQATFQTLRGASPREVLTRIRLERARQRLETATESDSVGSIAVRSGFTHLGRFAAAYLKAFGERPSVSLRRSLGLRSMTAQAG